MQTLSSRAYSITKKGQVTIPLKVRVKLGLKPGDEVFFKLNKNGAQIRAANNSLVSVYGSVSPLKKRLSDKKMRRIALEDKLDALR